MIVVRGHHFSFTVKDLQRSRDFYEGVLGLQQIERPNFPVPGVWYQVGETQVHLIEKPEALKGQLSSPELTPVRNHSAFQIDDYDKTRAHFELNGVEVLELGKDVGQMFVCDPDGNVLEFIKPGGQLGRIKNSN